MPATRRPYLRSERTISQYTALSPRRSVSPARSAYPLARVRTAVSSPVRYAATRPTWYSSPGRGIREVHQRGASGIASTRHATSPVRNSSPGRRRMSTSPARTPGRFGRQPEDSTLQLPVKTSDVPIYTDRDEVAATVLEAQVRDQLRTVRRDAAGSPGNVCPRCMSETTRLYAGHVCPRCLDADSVSADAAQRFAYHSTQTAAYTVPQLPSREPRTIYSPASRRSEIELAGREAEAREAGKRLQAALRRAPKFEVVPAVAARLLSPHRNLRGETLGLGFASRSSPRLDQLLHEFPDDSPTRANYRTPHAPRSPDPD